MTMYPDDAPFTSFASPSCTKSQFGSEIPRFLELSTAQIESYPQNRLQVTF
jgi:hypothetical protein